MKIIAAIRKVFDSEEFAGGDNPSKLVGCAALFRGQDVQPGMTVSLSRAGGGCNFSVAEMHEHDGHAPPWYDGDAGPKSIGFMPAYMVRVLQSVCDQAKGKPKIEVAALSDTGQLDGKAETFENLLQACEKAAQMPSHAAVTLTFK